MVKNPAPSKSTATSAFASESFRGLLRVTDLARADDPDGLDVCCLHLFPSSNSKPNT
jgi:hypothetical protein